MQPKQVAVFDFDPKGRDVLLEALSAFFGPNGADLFPFGDTQAVARAVQQGGFQMAFVAVESMPAVETARLVRESAPGCPLFLVSSTGDFALEGFRLHALDYLVRPVSTRRIGEAVARISSPALGSLQSFAG